jgi:hypothetical protein
MLTFEKDTHTYRWNGSPVPSVTQIIRDVGLSELHGKQSNIDIAGDFGDKVHLATEFWDKNELDIDALDLKLKPYLDCWIQFKKDYNIRILHTEMMLYHEALGYAGTIDRIVKFNSHVCVLDIKTGSTISQSTELQLAGYKLLYCHTMNIPSCSIYRMAVQLKPDGFAKVQPYKSPSDENCFVSAVNVYKRRIKYGYTSVRGTGA